MAELPPPPPNDFYVNVHDGRGVILYSQLKKGEQTAVRKSVNPVYLARQGIQPSPQNYFYRVKEYDGNTRTTKPSPYIRSRYEKYFKTGDVKYINEALAYQGKRDPRAAIAMREAFARDGIKGVELELYSRGSHIPNEFQTPLYKPAIFYTGMRELRAEWNPPQQNVPISEYQFSKGVFISRDDKPISTTSPEGVAIEKQYWRQDRTREINQAQQKLYWAITEAPSAQEAYRIRREAREGNPNVGTFNIWYNKGRVVYSEGTLGIGDTPIKIQGKYYGAAPEGMVGYLKGSVGSQQSQNLYDSKGKRIVRDLKVGAGEFSYMQKQELPKDFVGPVQQVPTGLVDVGPLPRGKEYMGIIQSKGNYLILRGKPERAQAVADPFQIQNTLREGRHGPLSPPQQFVEGLTRPFSSFATQVQDFGKSVWNKEMVSPKPFTDPSNPFGLPVPKHQSRLPETATSQIMEGKYPNLRDPAILGSAYTEAGIILGTAKYGNKPFEALSKISFKQSLKISKPIQSRNFVPLSKPKISNVSNTIEPIGLNFKSTRISLGDAVGKITKLPPPPKQYFDFMGTSKSIGGKFQGVRIDLGEGIGTIKQKGGSTPIQPPTTKQPPSDFNKEYPTKKGSVLLLQEKPVVQKSVFKQYPIRMGYGKTKLLQKQKQVQKQTPQTSKQFSKTKTLHATKFSFLFLPITKSTMPQQKTQLQKTKMLTKPIYVQQKQTTSVKKPILQKQTSVSPQKKKQDRSITYIHFQSKSKLNTPLSFKPVFASPSTFKSKTSNIALYEPQKQESIFKFTTKEKDPRRATPPGLLLELKKQEKKKKKLEEKLAVGFYGSTSNVEVLGWGTKKKSDITYGDVKSAKLSAKEFAFGTKDRQKFSRTKSKSILKKKKRFSEEKEATLGKKVKWF